MIRLWETKLPAGVRLSYEEGDIADVFCTRCDKNIGRLQTIPAEEDADEEEIYAEVRLIADEHQQECSG